MMITRHTYYFQAFIYGVVLFLVTFLFMNGTTHAFSLSQSYSVTIAGKYSNREKVRFHDDVMPTKFSSKNHPNKIFQQYRSTSTELHYRRDDSLIGGLAEISIAGALGVLWSEYTVLTTGCGPSDLSNFLERLCYEIVIGTSGVILFTSIVTGQRSMAVHVEEILGDLESYTLFQVEVAQYFVVAAVLGAFLTLYAQYYNGVNIIDHSLTGIDVEMCKALQLL